MQTYRLCQEQFFRSEKVTEDFRKSTDLYGDCQCRNSRYRAQCLHTARERHADRRDADTVSETDWRFLKRMASQLGLSLVPDTAIIIPAWIAREGEKKGIENHCL